MTADFQSVAAPASIETEVKKSRFVGYSHRVIDQPAMQELLNKMRNEHRGATHVCHGAIIGNPDSGQQLFDDDGEPGGTAGKPILNVLQHARLGDSCLIVVRYYGGIKLGAGGLVRAYSNCAASTLKATPLETRISTVQGTINCEFALENQVRALLKTLSATAVSPDYGEALVLSYTLPEQNVETLRSQLRTINKGKARVKLNFDKPLKDS